MAKTALKLEEMIDGEALRRDLAALAESADGSAPELRQAVVGLLKERLAAEPQAVATRKASEIALEVLTEAMPELVLGSADLTPSNNTKTKNLIDI